MQFSLAFSSVSDCPRADTHTAQQFGSPALSRGAQRADRRLGAVFFFALFVLFTLSGCGTLPQPVDRPVSLALGPSADGNLAAIARASTPSPELSGFRLLPLGLFSLDTRLQLAQRARHSLDVQYYVIEDDSSGRPGR